MKLKPITLRAANAFITANHRHHKAARGCLFCISVIDDDDQVRAVAIVGRPVARRLQDGWTCEVVRLASDGTRNACSMLYGAAARAAKAIGYRRIFTYTLVSEPGTSLRASGWTLDAATAGGGEWNCKARPRKTGLYPTEKKQRWLRCLTR